MKNQNKQIKVYTWDDVVKAMSHLIEAVEFVSRKDLKELRDSTDKSINTKQDVHDMMEVNLGFAYEQYCMADLPNGGVQIVNPHDCDDDRMEARR